MRWINVAATTTLAVVLGLSSIAVEAKTLRLGHATSDTNPRHTAALAFAEKVKEASGGKLTVAVAGNAQFGDDVEMISALRLGTLDMSLNSQGSLSGVVPEVTTLGLPFLFDNLESAWKVIDGPIGDELAKKAEEKNLIVLAWWDNGIRQITNNVRPITKPDDLKGLKLRVPPDPMGTDIFAALGANPTPMKFSELYLALQQGVVDGQENPIMNIYYSKFQEVQKFMSLSGHKYEVTPFLINKMAWSGLSQEEKDIILEAAREARDFQRQLSLKADGELLQKIKDAGVAVNEVDPGPFREATKSVYDKWQAQFGDFVPKLVDAARAGS